MAKNVTTIPATRNRFTANPINSKKKRRVAGYARVSTDIEEQQTSYAAQCDYYTQYIQSSENWEFVGLYSDEGITACNTFKCEGFNRMIDDALAGRIDLIITKSVSRFARNTVDSLTTVRKLKDAGVGVYFEKENIYTFDSKGELLITIMSSLAQEESRSISENVTWGQRKCFADGKVTMPYKNFLGYDKGEDGKPVINENEAEIVRLIYRLFLQGKNASGICKHLDGLGIPTPTGKKAWNQTTINSILCNEKYKGDALLQKKFTVDFLTKKQKVNEGEIPQYYVEDNHPAIIDPLEFDMVQAEIARRQKLGRSYSGASIFSSKVICGECGSFYGQKIWHSNDPYRKVVWRCNRKFNGKYVCETPTLNADEIKEKFIIAYNQLLGNRKELLEACEVMCEEVGDCSGLNAEIDKLNEEIEEVTETVNRFVKENASKKLSQESYDKKYNSLVKRYEKADKRLTEVTQERNGRINRERELRIFISELSEKPLVIEKWDEELWVSILEAATVHKDRRITFMFKNGRNIEAGAG